MAKASDNKLTDATKKRPSSSPKPEEISDVPKIYLNERKQTSSSLPSSLQTSLYSTALPTLETGDDAHESNNDRNKHDKSYVSPEFGSNRPIRSSSDIGLPTGSTSYLMARGGTGSSESYLEVFCSPRTFRRSVDSGISSKEQGECMQHADSSNNCLKVLTSASRTGSALSLNSEYTARSIGLLSSDSGSDRETSLTDSESLCFKPAQLRRFMSYPDEDGTPELCARSSQSLGDINSAGKAGHDFDNDPDTTRTTPDTPGSMTTKSESATISVSGGGPGSPNDDDPFLEIVVAQDKDSTNSNIGVANLPNNMLSYKCDSHDAKRDIRIRQWLQDMDSQH